ncbi:uncharacterized protein PAM68-like [Gastrolobium bilobum]|uniref:uncharacterized protein PAM68-like n=1 Tax=Gastrolobium bilobum TaxID=150636 RepID=UPI002AB3141D|nr:uncharacterized protein PAM68-like [Gastrolobium bilobum]
MKQLNTSVETMKTLICASNPTHYISKCSPWRPKFPALYPRTAEKLNYPLSTIKPHANAKGFSSRPSNVESDVTGKKPPSKGKNNGDDELPQVVLNRIIGRILFSVGVPMGLGLALLYVFGMLKERQIWDVPIWIPFFTTFLTFGTSTLGIAFGTLSTSLDAEREGSFLGLNEVQKNWVEMWQDEDSS